ncbi:hypothetical protein BGZ52_004142 [Haplosporangium bisporale]|nr:hypothetical protein BGZ52_004142 [Haplosporangium bisporale]KAI9232072.1 MAG: hypothetical protein BYD32DRAFT_375234 [Podila humilis]KFH67960.1 hypothetical protein MVEG_06691 [Podila verticillata NRRL 6337]
MSLSDACCTNPAANPAPWTQQGHFKTLPATLHREGRRTYRTGPKDSKHGIIVIYDVLGYTPTGFQFFDRLATSNGGFQISAPQLLPEGGMPVSLLESGDRPAMFEWIGKNGDYDAHHLAEAIDAAVQDLRNDGCTTFAIYGQCWGAIISAKAASEEGNVFLAFGGPHPSIKSVDWVKDVKCPMVLCPAKDDDDMTPLLEVVNSKNFAVKSTQKRFENVVHGWTGGRGDWSDPVQLQAGLEAIQFLTDFYLKTIEAAKAH